jgi:hypothetical protein
MEDELLHEEHEQSEKTFTQAELDKIVADRLARAKSPEDYDDLKEVLAELEEYGYPQSAKEAREMIKQQKATAKAEKELEELEFEAEQSGTSPELLKEIRELKSELKELKDDKKAVIAAKESEVAKIEADKKANEQWQAQVDEIETKYPDINLAALEENVKFMKFIKGKGGQSLVELYEDFNDLIGEAESSAIKKAMSKVDRSTGTGKGNTGSTSILNDNQKKTLTDWNRKNPAYLQMSEKEFLATMNR